MQNAVDDIRARQGSSIEQIMLDMVANQPDGLGPCTRIDCLLNSAVEAARIFIFEQQDLHFQREEEKYNNYAGSNTKDGYHNDYDEDYDKDYGSGDVEAKCYNMCMGDMDKIGFTDGPSGGKPATATTGPVNVRRRLQ
jgi:hypothetical protein